MCPYMAGGRSRRGSPNAGTTHCIGIELQKRNCSGEYKENNDIVKSVGVTYCWFQFEEDHWIWCRSWSQCVDQILSKYVLRSAMNSISQCDADELCMITVICSVIYILI